jgi:carbon monoxide dehydrogenase subunit G
MHQMPRVKGTERLNASRQEVWRLLNDPDTLAASIPGCRGFERDSETDHRYRTAIKVAVGPVTGVYEGTVEYTEVAEPERCTIVVAGKGDKGTIEGKGAITLAPSDGSTEVSYEGEFKLTGPVAGVGQRMAPGVSRKMIVETLRNLERRAQPDAAPTVTEDVGDVRPVAETAQERDAAVRKTEPSGAPTRAEPESVDEVFRPFAISPAAAFVAGLIVGGALGAALVALL